MFKCITTICTAMVTNNFAFTIENYNIYGFLRKSSIELKGTVI